MRAASKGITRTRYTTLTVDDLHLKLKDSKNVYRTIIPLAFRQTELD